MVLSINKVYMPGIETMPPSVFGRALQTPHCSSLLTHGVVLKCVEHPAQ